MPKKAVKRVLFAALWWQHDLMRGVARHAAEHGWHLDMQMLLSGVVPERWGGDGVITTMGSIFQDLQHVLDKLACPVVSLSLNAPDMAIPRVGIDNDAAGLLASEHFMERGFRHFAFYNRIKTHAGKLRFQGFARHVQAAGYDVQHLEPEDAETSRPDAWLPRQVWLRSAIRELPKPLAVFAHDDSSAVEVIESCQYESIRVPEEVAVLGMLDIDLLRESTTVPLSSITVDFDAYTRTACDLLAEMMAGKPPPHEPILFPPSGIAVRRSTDIIAAQTDAGAKAIQFMQAHFAEPISVMDVARDVGMSHTKFYQAFKNDLGQPPNTVLTRIRLDHAKRILTGTKWKLEAVAETCGFGDRINLHRHFKRHVGVSPAAYRKRQNGI